MNEITRFSLRDVLNVFYRHVKLFWLVVVLFPIAALWASLQMHPVYESQARIMLIAKKETSTLLQNPIPGGASLNVDLNVGERDLNSEMEILTSRDLWTNTVKSLGVGFFHYPQPGAINILITRLEQSIKSYLGQPIKKMNPAEKERERVTEVVDYLLGKLKVKVASKSNTINMVLRYPDRSKATAILQELLKLYIPYHIEVYSLPGAEEFFGRQGSAFKRKLDESIQALTQFNKKEGLYLPEKQKAELIALMEKTRESLISVNSNLVQYEQMLAALDKGQLPSGQLTPSTERGSENTFLTILASQLLQAEQKSWQSGETYSSDTRDSRITSGMLKELRDRFKEAISVERGIALSKRVSLEKSLKELESKLERLEENSERAKELKLRVTIAEKRYLQYLGKEEEARIESLKGGNKLLSVSIVGKPTEPTDAVFPKTKLYVLAAFILGFPVGLTVVLLSDFFDHAFYSPAQLEQATGYPVLTSLDKMPDSPLARSRMF